LLLVEALKLLSSQTLADIFDTLYQPSEVEVLTDNEYRSAIVDYWSRTQHWNELVVALSVPERQALTRLALGEKHPIDPFVEQLSELGLLLLHRERNHYLMPDDVRAQLLERLPSLQQRLAADASLDDDDRTGI